MGFLPWGIQVAFPGESQLRQSRATQPTVHAGCFNVSIVHRILTWTTGSLTCGHVNACNCARECRDTVRESALRVDSGRKIPCRTGEPNLRRRRAGPILPTELHPHLESSVEKNVIFLWLQLTYLVINDRKPLLILKVLFGIHRSFVLWSHYSK